jgi:hypothetical protein
MSLWSGGSLRWTRKPGLPGIVKVVNRHEERREVLSFVRDANNFRVPVFQQPVNQDCRICVDEPEARYRQVVVSNSRGRWRYFDSVQSLFDSTQEFIRVTWRLLPDIFEDGLEVSVGLRREINTHKALISPSRPGYPVSRNRLFEPLAKPPDSSLGLNAVTAL